ncbi:MAG: class I SAM-dependent methyltransferase [Armatimonadota bacterium]
MNDRTREPQYQSSISIRDESGLTPLGLMSNQVWHDDPKRFLFMLSRYKFVAKMLNGLEHVLEVGCADAFGTRIVQQAVAHVTAIDFDPVFVKDVHERMEARWPFDCFLHDMLEGPVQGKFDAAYALDVIEHIKPEDEHRFLSNIVASLNEHGILIIGTPTLQSQEYASPPSRAGHINCKDFPQLKTLLAEFYHNVFVFSMNDEIVHTGFYPLAHYLLALCCDRK